MHQNPDYSRLFRGRPLRFVLPLKNPDSKTSPDVNLITIDNVYQKLETFKDRLDNKRSKNEKRDKDDNNNNNNNNNNTNNNNNNKENLLERKAAAFRLPNGNIFVKPELLCDLGCETPRINNESHLGKEYRYFYAISSDVDIENPGTV